MSKKHFLYPALLAALCGSVQAQTIPHSASSAPANVSSHMVAPAVADMPKIAPPTAPGPQLKDLVSAQGQILLLGKQIDQAQLDIKLQASKLELQRLRRELASARVHPVEDARTASGVIDVGPSAPSVISIEGGALTGITADLEFPNRTVQRVKVGAEIPGGWKVTYISPGQVTLSKPGQPNRVLPILFRPGAEQSVQSPIGASSAPVAANLHDATLIPPPPANLSALRAPTPAAASQPQPAKSDAKPRP